MSRQKFVDTKTASTYVCGVNASWYCYCRLLNVEEGKIPRKRKNRKIEEKEEENQTNHKLWRNVQHTWLNKEKAWTKSSNVWEMFFFSKNKGEKVLKCRLCKAQLSFHGSAAAMHERLKPHRHNIHTHRVCSQIFSGFLKIVYLLLNHQHVHKYTMFFFARPSVGKWNKLSMWTLVHLNNWLCLYWLIHLSTVWLRGYYFAIWVVRSLFEVFSCDKYYM